MDTHVPQTLDDLQRHFDEQVSFLRRSADAFDQGFDEEAKRFAVTLRVLLHSTAASKVLLDQLGLKNTPFLDTAALLYPHSLLTQSALTSLVLRPGAPPKDSALEEGVIEPVNDPVLTFGKAPT